MIVCTFVLVWRESEEDDQITTCPAPVIKTGSLESKDETILVAGQRQRTKGDIVLTVVKSQLRSKRRMWRCQRSS